MCLFLLLKEYNNNERNSLETINKYLTSMRSLLSILLYISTMDSSKESVAINRYEYINICSLIESYKKEGKTMYVIVDYSFVSVFFLLLNVPDVCIYTYLIRL
jgi:hypothetical protein